MLEPHRPADPPAAAHSAAAPFVSGLAVATPSATLDTGAARTTAGPPEPDEDAQLLVRYAAGDEAAFTRIYARHERPVYRFLLRSVGNAGIAEELHQEVWMSVIRGAIGYQPQARFTTWLYRIARNRLVDHWRAADPAVLDSLDAPVAAGSDLTVGEATPADRSSQPEVRIESRDQARHFVAAVEALPPPQREAFLLHAQAGLSLDQVSKLTGAGVETIKSRFRYASAKLRDAMRTGNPA